MKMNIRTSETHKVTTFGIAGDVVLGLVGAVLGALLGSPVFASLGLASYGLGAMVLTASVGAFTILFLANIIKFVAHPRTH